MCIQYLLKKVSFKKINSPTINLLAILLGIYSGLSGISILQNFGILISDIFIKVFKCIGLPLIAISIIVTLSNYNTEGSMQKIWQRTLFYTLSTTMIAASIACALYLLIKPENVNLATYNLKVPTLHQSDYFQHLSDLIPSNIFSPFLENQVMGVLLVGIVVGIAILYIREEESRKTITNFFKGMYGVFLVITTWIVAIIPLGLYGFITAAVVQIKEGIDFKGISGYLSIVILANLLQAFILLPLWLRINHIKPFETMRIMLPALSVAFFSKSSTGALPTTIEMAEKNLKITPNVSRFVLPLCTAINMNGCAAFIFTTVVYLMQNHGINITLSSMLTWIIIATIAAIGNAGVPMGCLFLSASLLTSMNVPITFLGIIIPLYSIIDMIETALNVWSDLCVAIVVDKKVHLNEKK